MSRRFWTEEKIISEIQKLNDKNEDLWYRAMERNHKDLIRASERYFKGWKNAVVAAGLDYNLIKKRSHQVWTEEKIMNRLHELQMENPNLKPSTVQNLDKKLYHATIRQFQNFSNALSRLNEIYNNNEGTNLQAKSTPDIKPSKASAPNLKPKSKLKPSLKSKSGSTSKTKTESGETQSQKPIKDAKPTTEKPLKIFTVRTRIRSERSVGKAIEQRAKNQNITIGNIQYPAILNGYLFVECEDRELLNRLIKNIRNAQGLLNGETTHGEITEYLETPRSKKQLTEGSRIEITDGQFKGERAVIQHINDRTKNLTVELMDEVFKMPIVIRKTQCKILS